MRAEPAASRNGTARFANSIARPALWLATPAASWLGMMATHEAGHVIAARLTGGSVARVVLHPLGFSRTDLFANPHPQLVAWGGPVLGALLPLALFGVIHFARLRSEPLARFFAGFCLVANGAYLAAGAFVPIADAADLLRHGAQPIALLGFAVPAIIGGLAMWNGLGRHFGIRRDSRPVDRALVASATIAAVSLFTGMLLHG